MDKVDIGRLVVLLRERREDIAKAQAKADETLIPLKEAEADIEAQLIAAMDKVNTLGVRTPGYSVTLEKSVLPRIVDSKKWDRYCKRHDALHLYERRIARVNFAEWLKAHPEIRDPAKIGVQSFTKKSIRIYKLGDKDA